MVNTDLGCALFRGSNRQLASSSSVFNKSKVIFQAHAWDKSPRDNLR